MQLELGKIKIEDIQFAAETKVFDSTLFINQEELLEIIGEDLSLIHI